MIGFFPTIPMLISYQKLSAFITLVQGATKSFHDFFCCHLAHTLQHMNEESN